MYCVRRKDAAPMVVLTSPAMTPLACVASTILFYFCPLKPLLLARHQISSAKLLTALLLFYLELYRR